MASRLSKADIAQYMDIDWKTVGRCIERAFHELEPDPKARLKGLVNIGVDETSYRKVHNPEIFVREIQILRTLVRHFHTGAILKSHTAVHIFSYENPEVTYIE